MSKIMIMCPNTKRDVWTGVETDANSFRSLAGDPVKMACSACGETHTWTRRDAWLAGFEKTLPPSPGRAPVKTR